MTTTPHLFAARGGGSAIIEALFAWANQPCDITYIEWGQFGAPDSPLLAHNPLHEVPTLLLPGGGIMTESAAITLWLAEQYPGACLAPPPHAPTRAAFLRWLVWLVSALYPTFTYGDHPERWLPGAAKPDTLRTSTDARREALWRQFDAAMTPAPWLLGAEMSALDIYLTVMTWWRPRRDWFKTECPRLYAVADRLSHDPRLTPVWRRNNAPL